MTAPETPPHTPRSRLVPCLNVLGTIRKNLFSGWFNTLLTLLTAYLLIKFVPPVFDWAILSATFSEDPAVCRASGGACWGFLTHNWDLLNYGTYPVEQQWRPFIAMVLLIGVIVLSLAAVQTRFLRRFVLPGWIIGLPAIAILMWGGVFGLPYVDNSFWNGLPLTLILSVFGIIGAFPLGLVLALGRQSQMPVIRSVCVVYIEIIRGVPLITILFMASLMIPLFLPDGVSVDKLLRAQIGIILFTAAYLAEVFRGGLQAVPRGQFEAADSLGLTYWQSQRLIILPQALRVVIPPTVNSFISMFKDTTLVIIVGLFDYLGTIKLALRYDPVWTAFYIEAYFFAALVFFVFCYSMSKYSIRLEQHLRRGEQH